MWSSLWPVEARQEGIYFRLVWELYWNRKTYREIWAFLGLTARAFGGAVLVEGIVIVRIRLARPD